MTRPISPAQLPLPDFMETEQYACPICNRPARLFGQYTPLMPWGVCRECSIKHPYPVELFIPSTRRNADKEPLMIDPSPEQSKLRELRVGLDEMLRCAVDPTRIERPIVKYNLSGLELRNPIRRSRAKYFNAAMFRAKQALQTNQMHMPLCPRCGHAHDRFYELMPGHGDYKQHCQHCDDELVVETFWNMRGIFGADDDESILDRIQRSHPELFERGVLPDFWFQLKGRA